MKQTMTQTWKRGKPLKEETQARLRAMIGANGEDRVAEILGISVTAVLRGAANAGLRQGTIRLIEVELAALDNKNNAAA